MTKSTEVVKETSSVKTLSAQERLDKFLGEFGVKDTRLITKERHLQLMKYSFYWVDKETDQGYHIHGDIEGKLRSLGKEEHKIYNNLYFDAERY